ncbi:hypothetical protein SUBVAR_04927 [Subdoligranulum variabile DSM 15176]|uniref:Uncharacterized protein n=1 Tax=Subdoligranulum variabile DSM 15176 TaxID=411471 RepID=D1PKQ0_9FIRM|nr:hypothetical protein SUBVAR_04927 [Subdoligranulum variabile DSM 15176]
MVHFDKEKSSFPFDEPLQIVRTAQIVEMDVLVDQMVGLLKCLELLAINALRFENGKEIFHHCIVIRVPTS